MSRIELSDDVHLEKNLYKSGKILEICNCITANHWLDITNENLEDIRAPGHSHQSSHYMVGWFGRENNPKQDYSFNGQHSLNLSG